MRIAVTGKRGQIVSALRERATPGVEIVALGRPEFDLGNRESVVGAFDRLGCDVIVNAAAHTAVDKAEAEPEAAMRVNADGPAYVAEAAARRPANSRLDATKFASVYGFSFTQWTKSLPVGVERWLDAPWRSEN